MTGLVVEAEGEGPPPEPPAAPAPPPAEDEAPHRELILGLAREGNSRPDKGPAGAGKRRGEGGRAWDGGTTLPDEPLRRGREGRHQPHFRRVKGFG